MYQLGQHFGAGDKRIWVYQGCLKTLELAPGKSTNVMVSLEPDGFRVWRENAMVTISGPVEHTIDFKKIRN